MFESVKSMFKANKQSDFFKKYDIEFTNRVFTNGIFMMGENDNIRKNTLELMLQHLTQKGYPYIYISTGQNDYIQAIEEIVTTTRNTRRYQEVTGEMASVNSINFIQELQKAKIVSIDLQKYSDSDKEVVLQRINLQFKKLFHDLYTNFTHYKKKEGLRGVIFIDEYDVKDFKVFSNMEFFQTMKDYDIGFVFCVEDRFDTTKMNGHKEQLLKIPHFNFWQS